MQHPASGSSDALHLNYSTTNINKTHIMSLGVVLQLGESPPTNFYNKEVTVFLWYTEVSDCGHVSLLYCATPDHYVHGVF